MNDRFKDIHILNNGIEVFVRRECENLDVEFEDDQIIISFDSYDKMYSELEKFNIETFVKGKKIITINLLEQNKISILID